MMCIAKYNNNGSKETGHLPIQMHEAHTKNELAWPKLISHQQIQEITAENRASDETRSTKNNMAEDD